MSLDGFPISARPRLVSSALCLLAALGAATSAGAQQKPAAPGTVEAWGRWNLAAGFGLMMAGFAMTTRWR